MDLSVYIQLIFLWVVNIIFAFSWLILNTLVIVSFLKSSQLRKKLCHFMIMVLSCSDLVAVITNHPGLMLFIIAWSREDCNLLFTWKTYLHFSRAFLGFSFCALLAISIERYLGAYYQIFHRTSVTRRRLLALLAILLIFQTALHVIAADNVIISTKLAIVMFIVVVFPPLVYPNFKLFKISRKVHRRKAKSPEKGTTKNLKTVSTCLFVVASLVVLSISVSLGVVFNINTKISRLPELGYHTSGQQQYIS